MCAMSYFSDSSSTYSATPVTPSHSYHSIPRSQSHSYPHSLSYSSPYESEALVSPPDSIRLYSSALKARMAVGLTAAMRDLKDDRGGPERKFDAEYGYDEDPIERHVRMHLTPRKVPEKSKPVPELGLGMRPISAPPAVKGGGGLELRMAKADVDLYHYSQEDTEMLAPASPAESSAYCLNDEDGLDPLPAKFRPGLIHFRRSNSSSNTRPSFSRMSSTVSNTSTVSMMSEASFEAVRTEDIISMYGGTSTGVKRAEGPFVDDEEEEEDVRRASMESTETRDTIRPTKTLRVTPQPVSGSSYSPAKAYPYETTLSKLPPPELTTRPSLLRPRPRAHPYEAPADPDAEPDWLAGRTVSERMVAQAGLRCQRQRTGVVRAGR